MTDFAEQFRHNCKHFAGTFAGGKRVEKCEAGVSYDSLPKPGPCMPKFFARHSQEAPISVCHKFMLRTEEEVQAEVAEWDAVLAKIDSGKSACCDADLVTRAHSRGENKFCSKCGVLVVRACHRGK